LLRKLFRRKFVSALQRNFRQGKIGFPGTLKPLAHPKAFSAWWRTLYRHRWHVYSEPPFGDADHAVRYLGHYTHRISNHRLVPLADDQVTFRWRDSAHNNEQKLMTLSLDEFLTRFLLHLLPKGFVRIRHFGFLANRRRATFLPLCFRLLGAVQPSQTEAKTSPAEEPSPLWLCPKCGGRMVLIETLTAAQIQLPVLHPFSPELPHDTKIPISLLGASHHPLAWCALRAPKPAPHFQPRLKLSHSERGFIGIFEVFHEYPLEFEGYLLSCAKMPSAKESDPN
jgi:hypothetical protein